MCYVVSSIQHALKSDAPTTARREHFSPYLDDGNDGVGVVALDLDTRHDAVLHRPVRFLLLHVHLVLDDKVDAPSVVAGCLLADLEDPVEDILDSETEVARIRASLECLTKDDRRSANSVFVQIMKIEDAEN